jgi:hypothetical protein
MDTSTSLGRDLDLRKQAGGEADEAGARIRATAAHGARLRAFAVPGRTN